MCWSGAFLFHRLYNSVHWLVGIESCWWYIENHRLQRILSSHDSQIEDHCRWRTVMGFHGKRTWVWVQLSHSQLLLVVGSLRTSRYIFLLSLNRSAATFSHGLAWKVSIWNCSLQTLRAWLDEFLHIFCHPWPPYWLRNFQSATKNALVSTVQGFFSRFLGNDNSRSIEM